MPSGKEVDFFGPDELFQLGFRWYESHFDGAGSRKVIGEASPVYTMKEAFPEAARRIAAYDRNLKLIYVVREPFSRIESLWAEMRSYIWHGTRKVHHDFNVAARIQRDLLVDSSNYLRQIDEYRRYYADDRILVLFYEDFREDPARFMRRCFEFLDVDPDVPLEDTSVHAFPFGFKPVVRPSFSRFQDTAVYRITGRLLPYRVKTFLKHSPTLRPLIFTKARRRPRWNAPTRQFVLDVLRDDLLEFLERYGKPPEFWKSLAHSSVPLQD